jgi:hypothetical protein
MSREIEDEDEDEDEKASHGQGRPARRPALLGLHRVSRV